MAVHRNRVIYQSEALFISPDATGYHQTGHAGIGLPTPALTVLSAVGWQCDEAWPAWASGSDDDTLPAFHGTIIQQLKRVQNANYGFTVNRTDVNQFGHLARLDSVVLEAPTVNLDFSYYLVDGYNERMLELVTNGTTNTLSGALNPALNMAGSNFFILTVPEARDAVLGDVDIAESDKSVISLGNGYMTDYSVDISVGGMPTASVTIEGLNIKSDIGETGNDVPGLDMKDGSLVSDAWSGTNTIAQGRECYPSTPGNSGPSCTGLYSLPAAVSGYSGCAADETPSCLRPGDVVLNLKNAALLSKQVSGDANDPLVGSAHVQSVSISLPMGRTTLQRLGSTFGFTKALDVPITATLTASAILSDVKEGKLTDLICSCENYDLEVVLHDPECADCTTKDGSVAMRYFFKGARLDSENYSSTIGDNKTVDLSFSTQVGSSDDLGRGVFISGKESTYGMPPGFNSPAGNTYEFDPEFAG